MKLDNAVGWIAAAMFLLAAADVSAESLFNLADAYSGVPFTSATLEIVEASIQDQVELLASSPDGRHVYISDHSLGHARISTFERRADGRPRLWDRWLCLERRFGCS